MTRRTVARIPSEQGAPKGDMNIPDWCANRITGCKVKLMCKDTDKYVCNKDDRFTEQRLAQAMGVTRQEAREHLRNIRKKL